MRMIFLGVCKLVQSLCLYYLLSIFSIGLKISSLKWGNRAEKVDYGIECQYNRCFTQNATTCAVLVCACTLHTQEDLGFFANECVWGFRSRVIWRGTGFFIHGVTGSCVSGWEGVCVPLANIWRCASLSRRELLWWKSFCFLAMLP